MNMETYLLFFFLQNSRHIYFSLSLNWCIIADPFSIIGPEMVQRWSSDFDVQIVSAKIRSYEIKLLSVLEYLEGDMVSSVTYTLYLPCKATSIY